MPHHSRERLTTYLVALSGEREQASGARVYAVRTRSAAEALAAVQASIGVAGTPVIVGSLSTRTAKAMGLKAGDIRVI